MIMLFILLQKPVNKQAFFNAKTWKQEIIFSLQFIAISTRTILKSFFRFIIVLSVFRKNIICRSFFRYIQEQKNNYWPFPEWKPVFHHIRRSAFFRRFLSWK